MEITARLSKYLKNGKHNLEIIPITYEPRTVEQGKKINWKVGVKAFFEIIKYNF